MMRMLTGEEVELFAAGWSVAGVGGTVRCARTPGSGARRHSEVNQPAIQIRRAVRFAGSRLKVHGSGFRVQGSQGAYFLRIHLATVKEVSSET